LHAGDTINIEHTIQPSTKEVVGGWPIIMRDGVILGAVDSAGATFAPVRHPRTAAAIFPNGRLMLLVVDGRQKPYSDGMTLRELARVFQSLGARDAINLDGGGSSTFVLRDADGVMRIQNRPSDKVERPVSNVLAVIGCN
jgi:exopolysaccharide biosynthesis protein